MINYMLGKLTEQVRESATLQKDGDLVAAFGGYELVFEALRFYEGLGYGKETESIQRLALEVQPSPVMTLYCHSLILLHRRHYTSALEAIKAALAVAPDITMLHALKGRVQTALGDLPGAYETFNQIQSRDPAFGGAGDSLFVLTAEKEMPGEDYYDWLQHFHDWLRPASYVEIGLGHGRSLALAGPDTKAIGVDPYQGFWGRLNYVCPHGPATLFPLTSDDFFAQYDLREVMGRETFDLGFIDGLHLFEQALKDFINLERYSRKDSVILIHDCLPVAPIVAERERCTGFWTGDVWRIIPCLKTFRPDLKIMTIPTKPSGLGAVTNLDAASTVLTDHYDEIVHYYLSLNCPERFDQRRVVCNVGIADKDYVQGIFVDSKKDNLPE
ncbi:class I SAM-dependent methyltransferase [Oryzomonas japonica]|nr:class I SAM-dependent methyltransferase [Oryzomonas japonica]